MLIVELLIIMFLVSIAAGLVGSLVGLGGGVVVIPILTIGLGVDIHYAIGASIVSVIATSSGAAATYVRDKMTNLRVGMFLELGTTSGAIVGALIAAYANSVILELVFGVILLASLLPLIRQIGEDVPENPELSGLSKKLKLTGSYVETDGSTVDYNATRPVEGLAGMVVAGLISGLLGIGSGTFKVLSMDLAMKLPMKVSTTTSNFMIGVTAAASAGIYFVRGDVNPVIVAPVALGILIGAFVGARLLTRARNPTVRKLFAIVLALAGAEMVLRALGI
ncbi:MAG: sulfite exporter TauE/SafE family protein [Nitrososphaerota archaeon]|nr:sulfite exporter TauE/SafE family protein [Nitrososphaerota archaeon]MCL5672074.1 sulfite exporter TauE/SafE family protein [Nitrososphaerota archaeon]MDG6903647.1 sulfite exporter TauE/SafE family protein [Nitrososphaerota archaeon]MDG6911944.1 sulfite exporter TauE/SafE family protein [Nitrososphaerota archaeon]MDG6924496.1 sulfite exporter TauE/SafE family protein [Nitrososphaerota archaeon]